jgi:hypothetical protein
MDKSSRATLSRSDVKVRMNYLCPEQILGMLAQYLKTCSITNTGNAYDRIDA